LQKGLAISTANQGHYHLLAAIKARWFHLHGDQSCNYIKRSHRLQIELCE